MRDHYPYQPAPVPNPNPAAPPGAAGDGDGNQHQDRLERQMARARQRLQARAESLDRLRQRQRDLLYPNWAAPLGGNAAEMKTRRQNEMKKWSDENRAKYTARVESVEEMKDKEPATKVRQQAEKTLEKLKVALKSINKSAKYFETKEFRELIEPYLKLQSRLQTVVNSLEFNALDKELPFSKQKTTTETATNPPLDRDAQITADREFALAMARSLNEDHPNAIAGEQIAARARPLWERRAPESHQTRERLSHQGPITKKRKLSGERVNKVKNWLAAQQPETSEKNTGNSDKEKTSESNAEIKTEPGVPVRPAGSLGVASGAGNQTVKIEVDDDQPIVVDQPDVYISDDDDDAPAGPSLAQLADVAMEIMNSQPGPSGLKSEKKN